MDVTLQQGSANPIVFGIPRLVVQMNVDVVKPDVMGGTIPRYAGIMIEILVMNGLHL